ncbi:MAG TPA: hypothetical protein VH684_26510 [Xanthobacteraceae bacterium]
MRRKSIETLLDCAEGLVGSAGRKLVGCGGGVDLRAGTRLDARLFAACPLPDWLRLKPSFGSLLRRMLFLEGRKDEMTSLMLFKPVCQHLDPIHHVGDLGLQFVIATTFAFGIFASA